MVTAKKFKRKYHFVGILGSGMSSLAYFCSSLGHKVTGSDRSFDKKQGTDKTFQQLKKQSITIFPQNGKGITSATDAIVTSTAIEDDNPDIKKAFSLGIPILSRASLLAEIFNDSLESIAVAGTNGKTTISGVLSFCLKSLQQNPSYILGGKIINYKRNSLNSRAYLGNPNLMVIEADESDGSLKHYYPTIGIISNISKDHKEFDQLFPLFKNFAKKCKKGVIINTDCLFTKKLNLKNTFTFGINHKANVQAKNVKLYPFYSTFTVSNEKFKINLPGKHNIYNALAVIATLKQLKISLEEISPALEKFKGMHRRLELIGQSKSKITVIDDFAHNPGKIKASLLSCQKMGKRVIAIFQPHGFAPTKFLKNEYIDIFSQTLRQKDFLFMLKIFYAGGTTSATISSNDLIERIRKKKKNSFCVKERKELLEKIKKIAKPKDVVLLMGARDPSLHSLAKRIKKVL